MPRGAKPEDAWPEEVQALAREVEHHDWLYWVEAAPRISDREYDRLVERLRALAPDHPVLQRIGGGRAASGDPWVHEVPMLSLDKCYDEAGLSRWLSRVEGPLVVSPKIDGIAAALVYDDQGRLTVAATRGNGVEGEVMTRQMLTVRGVPHTIPQGPLEVRGEVYLPLSRFAELKDRFANPRNTAAGALKQKDPAKTAGYGLAFLAYSLLAPGFERESDKLRRLAQLGFEPVPYEVVAKAEAQTAYERWLARRLDLDYEIDGVVFEVDSVPLQEAMGSTAHHPRYAIAYKLPSEARAARLQRVEWSVSRTGTITPVAVIEPTQLSGATVTRASLHNAGMIRKLGITTDAVLEVVRRGGVIPKVERVVEAHGEPVPFPKTCPSCGSPVVLDGDFLSCPNRLGCKAQRTGVLEHFLKAIGVDGFGPAILDQLVEQDLVRTPADLFDLTPDQLLPLERMGKTLATKLVSNLQEARRMDLATFLVALGIREIGPTVAKALQERYPTVEALRRASEEELAGIPGIGPVIARNVVEGLDSMAPLVDELLEKITIQVPEDRPDDLPLAGKSFVFTGKLLSMTRDEAKTLVKELGGETPSGVRKDLTYLVVGDGSKGKAGSKLEKARAYNQKGAEIRILSEAEFVGLVRG